MRKIVGYLIALQELQFDGHARAVSSQAAIENLRTGVPVPILAHYDRLVARGKKGVAIARNGVCGECHLRITVGKLAALSTGTDIQLCDNCGRYLYLEEAPSGPTDDTTLLPASAKKTRRKAVQRVS